MRELTRRGLPVRALVHRLDERSEALRREGAEIVQGDLLAIGSVRAALADITRAYFCYPPEDGLLEATANFAIAARDAKLESVANLSQLIAREGHASALTRQHWLAERVLDHADVGATHLRATFFAEDYVFACGETIANIGKFFLPHGKGMHAPVAASDIARVAVGVLTRSEPHAGEVLKVTGPVAMTQAAAAEVFTAVLGRPVEHVDLSIDEWRATAERIGFPSFLIDHLCHAAQDCQRGYFADATDVVLRVGGYPPIEFPEFVRQHATLFSPAVQT